MRHFITTLILAAALVTMGAVLARLSERNRELRANIASLQEGITLYRTRWNESAASVQRLTLTLAELREEHLRDVERIRSLGIRLRRVRSLSLAATTTQLSLALPLTSTNEHTDNSEQVETDAVTNIHYLGSEVGIDSLAHNLAISAEIGTDSTAISHDICKAVEEIHHFSHHTPWVHIEGEVRRDTLLLDYHSIDTLHQIVHRVPRKFLFFRFGTKAIRQEIISSNPHTKIVYSEYIELRR
ncbi:MAG: hypothetical protein IKT66_05385 [Alistipes sp.]|nr:hypothetical protein [Alistipes sp.]